MLSTKVRRIWHVYSNVVYFNTIAILTLLFVFYTLYDKTIILKDKTEFCSHSTEDFVESYEYQPDLDYSENKSLERNPDINPGGYWKPSYCTSRYHTAIIIPYMNRAAQLPVLLGHLHLLMHYQDVEYRIFVVEQVVGTFNKALLMNIASMVVMKNYSTYDCFIFHDVDMIPEDVRNIYRCGRFPRHLSPAVNEFNYKLPYRKIAGGVLAITSQHFRVVNGFSNSYWGWGGEDDDMYHRIKFSNLSLSRPTEGIGRYTMLKHDKRKKWAPRFSLLKKAAARYRTDGIAQLPYMNYSVVSVENLQLFTRILVDIEMPLKNSTA